MIRISRGGRLPMPALYRGDHFNTRLLGVWPYCGMWLITMPSLPLLSLPPPAHRVQTVVRHLHSAAISRKRFGALVAIRQRVECRGAGTRSEPRRYSQLGARRSIMTNWRVRLPVMAAEEPGCLRDKTAPLSIADMKARQAAKIREIGEALMSVGLVTLDAQADALGLPRSTTWTILTAEHKGYGISEKVISLILNSEQLPRLVRAKIMEYAQEKAAGLYGGTQTHRFVAALSSNGTDIWPRLAA